MSILVARIGQVTRCQARVRTETARSRTWLEHRKANVAAVGDALEVIPAMLEALAR